jgi:hypothetical protein
MREAAAPARGAVRSIAHILWRVDMALSESLFVSAVMMPRAGEARVNRQRAPFLTDGPDLNQGVIRTALLPRQQALNLLR